MKEKEQQVVELVREWCGAEPASIEKLAGAGSNRSYYRINNDSGHSVIGCVGTSREENHAFITLARHFKAKGLPVPQVLAVSADEMCYLQEDLGSTSLFDALRHGREAGGQYNNAERQLLRQAMRLLPRVQFEGARGLDFSVCYPQPQFDEMNAMFDLNYFKYCFLKPSGVDFHELRLERDFRALAADLLDSTTGAQQATFMYRDFQARNLMLREKGAVNSEQFATAVPSGEGMAVANSSLFTFHFSLCCIDFQGGRRGPIYYDVASFLWQASARYPSELRQELADVYYDEAQRYAAMPPREEFHRRLRLFVLFRLLQVLGAYGFRGYFERKPHFLQSIPPAIDSLKEQLAGMGDGYPCLKDVLQRLVSPPLGGVTCEGQFPPPKGGRGGLLTVRIFSFSYKRGIPQDESGNGGGYVFDCRGTHNPGRYDEYKHLTGLDKPVVDFLERDGEILPFLDHVCQLADAHVQRYIDRGFTSLMFSFGCTGGQHRSVYSAQHLAEHIRRKFPQVNVQLCHREQGITKHSGSDF